MKYLGLFIIIAIVALFNIVVGGLCVEYVLNTWLSYIQHKNVEIPFIACATIGLFFAEPAIPAVVITWIIFLFI